MGFHPTVRNAASGEQGRGCVGWGSTPPSTIIGPRRRRRRACGVDVGWGLPHRFVDALRFEGKWWGGTPPYARLNRSFVIFMRALRFGMVHAEYASYIAARNRQPRHELAEEQK